MRKAKRVMDCIDSRTNFIGIKTHSLDGQTLFKRKEGIGSLKKDKIKNLNNFFHHFPVLHGFLFPSANPRAQTSINVLQAGNVLSHIYLRNNNNNNNNNNFILN